MEVVIHLNYQPDDSVAVSTDLAGSHYSHDIPSAAFKAIEARVDGVRALFDAKGSRPLVDPVMLSELGGALRDTFFRPFISALQEVLRQSEGRLLFSSGNPRCLNIPWELLPGPDGRFLAADGRWAVRRTTIASLAAPTAPLRGRPLRILFSACAPLDLAELDFEKEEEAILRIAHGFQGKVHLDVAETGSFDELRDLISELKPHIVHLSGHGITQDGLGRFCFENERGRLDERQGAQMAELLFAGKGVQLVFVSGCQSAQAGVAGLCQSLVAAGHVPLAIGWGASIADNLATEFARSLFHELGAGQSVDRAVCAARRVLFEQCQVRIGNERLLDASFALPQVYAAEGIDLLFDEKRPPERIEQPAIRYDLIGDGISGLKEGFVGRRRILQRTRPAMRRGDKTITLFTGIGGAGKSTLATRLTTRFKQEGWRIAAVQARRSENQLFCHRLLGEIATACQRLGREADERALRDGQRPLGDRLRLAIEVLNESKILLVLDNLEDLMPPPPEAPQWSDPDFGVFFRELASRLVGDGRAILTCRYLPTGFEPNQHSNVAHESLPDFTEADFFKYLRRHEKVAARIDSGTLPRDLLATFHRKLGGTPRFIFQACAVLSSIDPDRLRVELEGVAEPDPDAEPGEIYKLQQRYFSNLFLPQLYEALPAEFQSALSRLAVVEIPFPIDGVAMVANLPESVASQAIEHWLRLGLLQRFGEQDEVPLYAIYALQREFLTAPNRLGSDTTRAAHGVAAAFLQDCYETNREQELRLAIGAELLACLHHATQAQDTERARWATVRLSWRLIQRAEFAAARAWIEPMLANDRHPDLLGIAARAALDTGDWESARTLTEEEQGGRQAIGDRAGEAATWHNLATIDSHEGNYADARENFGKTLAMRQAIGDRAGEAATWHNLATIDLDEGNYADARENLGKALAMFQAIGDRAGEAAARHNLASIDLNEGNYADARENFGKALAMRQAIGDRAGEAATWHNLASIDLKEGNYADARENFGKALAMLQAIGDRAGEASTFYQIGFVAWQNGHRETGIRLVALCFIIESSIGSGGVKETVDGGLTPMAGELNLDKTTFQALLAECAEHLQRDRGASLVEQAFEGL